MILCHDLRLLFLFLFIFFIFLSPQTCKSHSALPRQPPTYVCACVCVCVWLSILAFVLLKRTIVLGSSWLRKYTALRDLFTKQPGTHGAKCPTGTGGQPNQVLSSGPELGASRPHHGLRSCHDACNQMLVLKAGINSFCQRTA